MTARCVVLVSAAATGDGRGPGIADGDERAIALAAGAFPGECVAIHAGQHWPDGMNEVFGFGLRRALHLKLHPGDDAATALARYLLDFHSGDLVLSGVRGENGGTGLLPYLVAEQLGAPIVANVIDARPQGDAFRFIQACGSERRRLRASAPVVATVSHAAREAERFAPALVRRGLPEVVQALPCGPICREPRIIPADAAHLKRVMSPMSASARERFEGALRLRAGAGELLTGVEPGVAAARILAALAENRLLPTWAKRGTQHEHSKTRDHGALLEDRRA